MLITGKGERNDRAMRVGTMPAQQAAEQPVLVGDPDERVRADSMGNPVPDRFFRTIISPKQEGTGSGASVPDNFL